MFCLDPAETSAIRPGSRLRFIGAAPNTSGSGPSSATRVARPRNLADVERVRAIQTKQDFLSVITSRHCKRAFADQAVPPAILVEIVGAAAHAPSSRNAQMWRGGGGDWQDS
jgi:hypothetical protein